MYKNTPYGGLYIITYVLLLLKPESLIPAAKKQKTSQTLPRFPIPPVPPASEDSVSYARHVKLLR